jgi:hypothetical protein
MEIDDHNEILRGVSLGRARDVEHKRSHKDELDVGIEVRLLKERRMSLKTYSDGADQDIKVGLVDNVTRQEIWIRGQKVEDDESRRNRIK